MAFVEDSPTLYAPVEPPAGVVPDAPWREIPLFDVEDLPARLATAEDLR